MEVIRTEPALETVDISVYAIAYAQGHETIYLPGSEDCTGRQALESQYSRALSVLMDGASSILLQSQESAETGERMHPEIAAVELLMMS